MPDDVARLAAEYTRMAHRYEERIAPRFEPIARSTVDLARLLPGQKVLDAGCGTGLATFLAAEQVGLQGEVTGLDASEGMLGIAEAKRQMRGGLAQVRFERGDVTKLAAEERFDAALCNLGTPGDVEACFANLRRALRPGGRLSVAVWSNDRQGVFDDLRPLLRARMVAEPEADLAALREASAARREALQRIGTSDALAEALRNAEVQGVRVEEHTIDVPFRGWRDAWDLWVSWGFTEQEVRALPGPEREALQAEARKALGEAPFTARWHVLHGAGVR